MKKESRYICVIAALILLSSVFAACASPVNTDLRNPSADARETKWDEIIEIAPELIPLADAPMPAASGTDVRKNAKAELDVSNVKDGYFMAKFVANTGKKVMALVTGPSGVRYQYVLNNNSRYEVLPLTDGNGEYQLMVCENTSGSNYAVAFSVKINVKLANEFAPFIRPNQYVNYGKDSEVIKKAAELTKNSKDVMDKIGKVYTFVVDNFTYDYVLAKNVESGYLPDVDAVLASKKGICFDYAAVMTSMLRSQGVPTKLVIGYAGDVYHAWINVYSSTEGWIEKAVFFDGKNWSLMDPTFVSTGKRSSDVLKYVGNGDNYSAKFAY